MIFATNNAHKLQEARAILAGFNEIVSLQDCGFTDEIPETADTFEGNALIKAKTIYEKLGKPCFADDSGLVVPALNGAPGVKSARYASEFGPVNHQANNQKLLTELQGLPREAYFTTVICLYGYTEEPMFFHGKVDGHIAESLSGSSGFGYDPLFIPQGYNQTFSELGEEIKNSLSHRFHALMKMRQFFSKIPPIDLEEYNYTFDEELIAYHPVHPKDHSRLLVFQNAQIQHKYFYDLPNYLNSDTLLVANDTKVIPARFWFLNNRGQSIQVFLLKPLDSDWIFWEAMVGNRKKFKEDDRLTLENNGLKLVVSWENRENNTIRLTAEGGTVHEAIEKFGEVPLPPYIEREVQDGDRLDYQAIFASKEGAVAAPTASLHFTEELWSKLDDLGIQKSFVTLHVSAGTFKPVTARFANEHEMHAERFEVTLELIDTLIKKRTGVTAIGTTSCRVLESLFFLGCKYALGRIDEVFVSSEDGYNPEYDTFNIETALHALRAWVLKEGGILKGETQIFIVPGYKFRLVQQLITNFHQPKSTLILMISCFLGDDWKKVYASALEERYRLFSYGDSSLLRGKHEIRW